MVSIKRIQRPPQKAKRESKWKTNKWLFIGRTQHTIWKPCHILPFIEWQCPFNARQIISMTRKAIKKQQERSEKSVKYVKFREMHMGMLQYLVKYLCDM